MASAPVEYNSVRRNKNNDDNNICYQNDLKYPTHPKLIYSWK